MKKYLAFILLIVLTVGILVSCAPNDTSSVGEISGDASTTVEVTDEAVIAEIKALLEKYNEYVLIVNMCEGALEYDNTFEVLDFPIFDWFDYQNGLVSTEGWGPTMPGDGPVTSLDRAVELIQRNTRHYAKRQLSYWKRDKDIKWLEL